MKFKIITIILCVTCLSFCGFSLKPFSKYSDGFNNSISYNIFDSNSTSNNSIFYYVDSPKNIEVCFSIFKNKNIIHEKCFENIKSKDINFEDKNIDVAVLAIGWDNNNTLICCKSKYGPYVEVMCGMGGLIVYELYDEFVRLRFSKNIFKDNGTIYINDQFVDGSFFEKNENEDRENEKNFEFFTPKKLKLNTL